VTVAGRDSFLGIDLGTTNIKAEVVDVDGTVISTGSAACAVTYGADGAAEQDLEDIWNGTLSAIRAAAAGAPGARVAAVGVSSQGGALQVLDRGGACSGPVIGWQDSRARRLDCDLTEEKGKDWFERHAGAGSSFCSIGQLLRLRSERALPPGFTVGWVGDLVVGRLCGRRAHDATSLSEAGLYNPSLGDADPDILSLLGVDRAQLPDLVPVAAPAGRLLADVAKTVGLPAGIPVGPAVHDQYAAALGCGVVGDGDTMMGAGTAWVLLVSTAVLSPPVGGVALVQCLASTARCSLWSTGEHASGGPRGSLGTSA